MNKKFLKKLSIFTSTILSLAIIFTGCDKAPTSGSNNSPVTQSKSTDGKYKIGFNNYLKGLYCLDVLENNAKFAADALGMEFVSVNDENKTEKVIQNVENLISSGVDGIVFFGVVDTVFPVVAKKCEDAKIPFVVYDHIPSEKTLEVLKKSPYFVGVVGEYDYDAGYPIGEYAAKNGLKKAILVTGKRGDTTHEARVKGFTDSFTKGGGQVLDVSWGNSTLADAVQKAEDLITAHPDVDAIYGTGGDIGLGALQALKKHPDVKAKVFITDLDPGVLEGLSKGDVAAANGAHWINASFATALLHNRLQNRQLKDKDGQAPILTVPILVLPNGQEKLYQKWWLENQPFTVDELKNLSYKWNQNVTLDNFQQILKNYSIKERLTQRVKEGKLTEDELKKAGVN